MENYTSKIEEILTQVLTEKSFSLEIIEKIKSLKDNFEASQKLNKHKDDEIKTLKEDLNRCRESFDKASKQLQEYQLREKEISTKEKNLEKSNYELEFQTKRANEIKELMMIVFKNPILRASTFSNEYTPQGSYNKNGGVTTESE